MYILVCEGEPFSHYLHREYTKRVVYKVHNFISLLVMRELVRIKDNSLPVYKKLCQLSQKILQISTRYLKAPLLSWSETIILRKNWANFKFYKSKLKFNKTPNSHTQCFYMWFTYAENTVHNLHLELFFWPWSNLFPRAKTHALLSWNMPLLRYLWLNSIFYILSLST